MTPEGHSAFSRIRPDVVRDKLAGQPLETNRIAMASPAPGIDLFWLPLGAGGHFVRLNGRIYEAIASRLDSRPPSDLYHSALEVRVPEARYVIESAPIRPS